MTLFQLRKPGRTHSKMKCAVLFQFAGNAFFFNEIANHKRRFREKAEATFAVLFAEDTGNVVGHDPHAAINQPDIATSAPETDFNGLKHDCSHSALREM